MSGMSNTPTAGRLFHINNNPQLFDENTNQYFRTMAANFIFISKRGRHNLRWVFALLKMIYKGPGVDPHKNWVGSSDI